MFIRKQATTTAFETFEVQSPKKDVMAVPGRIVRSFPERAVEISNSITEDSGFFAEIANFLTQMDNNDLEELSGPTSQGVSH